MRDRARTLRKTQTDAERRLWSFLRDRSLVGCKFRRQHPIGAYVCDFVCISCGLVIEIDGGQHAVQVEKDNVRTADLESSGFKVIRFWNHEVLRETEAVLARIMAVIESCPSPRPSPQRGEGVV